MTAKDAAALLGVSAPTIKRMVLDGRITPVEPYRPYVYRQNLRFTRAEVLRVKNLPPPVKPPRKRRPTDLAPYLYPDTVPTIRLVAEAPAPRPD